MSNFKHCGQCYRNINGKKYVQYTDSVGSTLKEAKDWLADELKEYPKDKFKIIKIDKSFYRIYKLSQ